MAESPYIIEGAVILREGETRTFSVIWEDFTTMSTAGCEGYINGSSDSANLFSGTSAVTGNTLTLPKFTVPTGSGGTQIVIEPAMDANSQVYKSGIVCHILKPGAEQ